MKGFVKTIEVVIASVILLIVINQFIIRVQHEPWSKLFIQRSLEDFLCVEENKINNYVMNNDYESFHKDLEYWMNGPYDFSIKIKDLPKPIVKVACICDSEDEEKLKSMLEPMEFNYNGRYTNIRLIRNDSINNINFNENPDIFVYFDKSKFKNDIDSITKKLNRGKGVLLISNLTNESITDPNFSNIFGFSVGSGSSSGNSEFYSISKPNLVSYRISKIFTKTPFRIYTSGGDSEQTGNIILRNKQHEIKTFTNETCKNCIEYPIDSGNYFKIREMFDIQTDRGNYTLFIENVNANKSIGKTYADLIIKNNSYVFNLSKGSFNNVELNENISILKDNGLSFSTTNESKGIATWLLDLKNNSDNNQLVKSLVLFTAVQEYKLDASTFDVSKPEKIPGKVFLTCDYYVPGYNGFDPYTIEILMWQLFK